MFSAPFRELVSSSYNESAVRVQNTVEGCRNEDGVVGEMSDIMTKYSNLDNGQVLHAMFDFLADKYDTKLWFVMVYNAISGYDNHAIDGNDHCVFRAGGKNAVSFSIKPPAARFDAQTDLTLSNFQGNHYSNALDAINALGSQSVNGQLAAVKVNKGLVGQNHAEIDLYWTNYDHLSVIALPL